MELANTLVDIAYRVDHAWLIAAKGSAAVGCNDLLAADMPSQSSVKLARFLFGHTLEPLDDGICDGKALKLPGAKPQQVQAAPIDTRDLDTNRSSHSPGRDRQLANSNHPSIPQTSRSRLPRGRLAFASSWTLKPPNCAFIR
jgi:hypothetical protein